MIKTSVVKRPGTSELVLKKNENIMVPDLLKYRGPGQPSFWCEGLYDIRDAENADESRNLV